MGSLSDVQRETLEEWRAEREIRGALARFCRGADRRDYELLRTAFHEDAWDDHGLFSGTADEFVAWQRQRHRNIDQCMHTIANCLIERQGNTAFVETYCTAVLHMKHAEGGYTRNSIGCRYVDRFENRGPGWRIALRRVAYDWIREERVTSILPEGRPLSASQRSRDDLVYLIREQNSQRSTSKV